jgi:glycosyltransferase involved in cell wall biosynthesis
MKKELVSVIIPTYNSRQWIERAINSVWNQTYEPIEIIVVDDGSNDGTFELVKQNYNHVILLKQQNQGSAIARNYGAGMAKGEVLAFLDADDIWAPDKIELQMKALAKYRDCGLCVTKAIDFRAFEKPPAFDSHDFEPVITSIDFMTILKNNVIYTSSAIVIREAFIKSTGFDPRFRWGEDHDLWLRIADNYKVIKIEEPLVGYQITPDGLCTNWIENEKAMFSVLDRWKYLHNKMVKKIYRKRKIQLVKKLVKRGMFKTAWSILAMIKLEM